MPLFTIRSIRSAGKVAACLLASAVMADAARAQPTLSPPPSIPPAQPAPINVEDLPPGTILPPGSVATPAMRGPAGAIPPGAAAPIGEPLDYWIVSSRHCKGKPAAQNGGCLEYFHRSTDRDLQNVGRDAFCTSIRPDQPVCFVVHGSYNWWRDVVNESRKINRWIRSADPAAPVQVVFFTWPSDGNMPFLFPVDIAVLGRKASQHAVYLASIISQLPPDQPVCLLGHSHGARASVAALHMLGGGAVEEGVALPPGYSTPRHLRAVLIAAAVDHNWLNPGERYSQALLVPEQVLLMRNSKDTTLAIYPLRFGKGQRAMGREGLGVQNRFAMDRMGKKIVELDASQFAGSNHSFADYHEHPELASSIVPYVYFNDSGPATGGYESARPIGPPQRGPGPEFGDPQPIAPASPDSAEVAPPSIGPKLAPAALIPISAWEPLADEPEVNREQFIKIQPRRRPPAREAVKRGPPPNTAKPSDPEKKPLNRFELRLER